MIVEARALQTIGTRIGPWTFRLDAWTNLLVNLVTHVLLTLLAWRRFSKGGRSRLAILVELAFLCVLNLRDVYPTLVLPLPAYVAAHMAIVVALILAGE